MEYIKEAIVKAKASVDRAPVREHLDQRLASASKRVATPPVAPPAWRPSRAMLNAKHLQEHRIVSFAMNDPSHMAFNLLRTRVRKVLTDNGWNSIAVTSPSPGCGKTMVALNLAFSLARASDCRVVLIDLDLRKPAVARTLGIEAHGSIARYFEAGAPLEDCFVEVADNLVVGLNDQPVQHSSEMMQSPRMRDLIASVSKSLTPDVLLFDLPPMRSTDDALAFLPRIDAALLVIGAGQTTAGEVEECERQISQSEKLLGVVLNKCEGRLEDYYG